MTIFINPFWLGVVTTIGVEILLIIGLVIYQADRKRRQ